MAVNEDQLITWSKAPSETEEEKCRNAVDSITSAIRKKFGNEVDIFLQGSYKNRTNVRKDSDVDLVVLHTGYYFPSDVFLSPEDKEKFWAGFIPSSYGFEDFKSEVNDLLISKFGSSSVERKNKCIRVSGNTYRVNADVVVAFEHHRLRTPVTNEAVGIAFKADIDGRVIDSYPHQHYENGVEKNKETSEKYKAVVRILKNVRNNLIDTSVIRSDQMPSFLVECLVWNVYPHHHFSKYSLRDTTRSIVSFIWDDMSNFERYNNYAEVSDLKWLLRGPKYKPEQAKVFMEHAWNYVG